MTLQSTVLAEFNTPYDLLHAAEKVRDKGIKQFDTYSPFPIHGMDDAMGLKDSNLDFIVLYHFPPFLEWPGKKGRNLNLTLRSGTRTSLLNEK